MTVSTISQKVTELRITHPDMEPPKFSLTAWSNAHWRGVVSEFISTMILVLFGCMSCIPFPGIATALHAAFGFGFVVMFNIQIFSHISGAYMNPAITLASVLWGTISIGLGIAYTIAQCAGAILGYGILLALTPMDILTGNVCVTGPSEGLTSLQTLGIETALTAALSFINCGVWDPVNAARQDSMPIKFGLAVAGISLVGGPLTGSSMNPARTLGPAVWTGYWTFHWTYWVGPLVGSGLAALFYKHVFLKKHIQ